MRELGRISSTSVVNWRNFFRDVCAEYFIRNPVQTGGPGIVVEIDETMAVRHKYNKGRIVANEIWLFGGIELGNHKNCFVMPVITRNANTILPLIQQYIRPRSIIYINSIINIKCAYGGIPNLLEGYTHFMVNHSQNFVDPITGAYTQSIESLWQKLKQKNVLGTRAIFMQPIFQNSCGVKSLEITKISYIIFGQKLEINTLVVSALLFFS